MADPLKLLDLFSGAGGLSHGFASTGFYTTVAAVESDWAAAASFKANHPNTTVVNKDIASWLQLGALPATDVVVGGPPCQGFSNLGKRRTRDPRNALWRRYVETLVCVQPMVFVLENVADFLKSGQLRDLRRETHRGGRLADYRIEVALLNSAHYGAAQVRKRAVVVGSHRDFAPMGHPPPSSEWVSHPRTVRDVIGDLPLETVGIDLPIRNRVFDNRVLRGPFLSADLHLGRRPTAISLKRYSHIPPGGNRRDIPTELLSSCWRAHTTGSGDVMGRLHWDRPSVTIRTEFWKPEKGRYLHPHADRPITHLEACRIQGFPDDYVWFGSKAEIGRQIGNAVPYELGRALALHVADRLELQRTKILLEDDPRIAPHACSG